ncbi:hydrophobin-251 [Pisolithus orientalis]|uniref:hydrophobin-251 n=1 Tax=Pisolithus orientalis TaxID=936130 RepID=UPI00222484B6|nr:hydrophobin-251 [Pisolithus orientalis]KAI6015227.1 hydrophobin-251 [Pisolithus orientalis]
MFVNTFVFFVVALAAIATAAPSDLATGPTGGGGGGGSCNANALCCNNVGTYNQLQGVLGGLAGINVNALNGNLGVGCVPIEVIGLIPDNSCNAQAVCCEGTTFANAQLVGLNCDPIKVL